MFKKTAATMLLLFTGLAFIPVSCNDSKYISESTVRSRYKNAKNLNDTARFLAGMDIDKGSSLYALTQNDQYRLFQQQINPLWEQYSAGSLKNIEAWRKANLQIDGSGLVMYPFSGPDILNALAFFPGAGEFVMIGLELPGNVPDPLNPRGINVYAELWKVKNSLRTILHLNLFRTSEMMADFKADSFSNITGIMMFFLARYGYEILDIKKVFIDNAGVICYDTPPARKDAEGVEFVFRKKAGSSLQTARFFSVDLSDASLSRLRGFSAFLSKRRDFTTFIKSASYLLSYDNFKVVRAYLLAGSKYIVQEDSGVPYKYYSEKEWKMRFYGTYRVTQQFATRYQKDLDEVMKQKTAGPLPFEFGYGFVKEKSNIMIAEKVKSKKL